MVEIFIIQTVNFFFKESTIKPDDNNKTNDIEGNSDSNKQQLAPVATLYSSEDSSSPTPIPQQTNQYISNSSADFQFRIPDAFGTNAAGGSKVPVELIKSASMNNICVSVDATLQKPSTKQLLGLLPNRGSVSAVPSSCGHYGAGQELCYLCHQRAKRNVPIYLHEEKRHKEAEEQQLLQQYQHLKDTEKQMKDESNQMIRREERAKMDAFNLGVAEAIRNRKVERPKSTDVGVRMFNELFIKSYNSSF